MKTPTPFGWLSGSNTSSTDKAMLAYLEALRQSLGASLKSATIAYNGLKNARDKLGLPFITSTGGEGSVDVGGWGQDLEVQAQNLHAIAVFLDKLALDVQAGKRDLNWNDAFGNFSISALPDDLIRVEATQAGVPVIVDAKTGNEIDVNAPLGVNGVNWIEVAVVAAIPTVGIYLMTTKALDTTQVIAEQKTQRTLAEAAKKHADLVSQGKATPEQAKTLDESIYGGANTLQQTVNKPKLESEKSNQKWADTASMVAWAAVVVAGIFTLGKLIPTKSLLENPKPTVRAGWAYSTGRAKGLRNQDWQYSRDADWLHVLVDEGTGYRYLGMRNIDGVRMAVWYDVRNQRYVAQSGWS
jgi:hypothetical protein